LSRVTNDIDNVAQSLQQTLSMMLTSTLTIIGVVIMMISISPLLAVITIVTVPLSLLTMRFITSRSKKRFIAQWRFTGTLNGQIEEAFTGHNLVRAFGQQDEVQRTFDEENEELYLSSFGAQFISGTIQPAMMFLGNLNFLAIAVVGGLRVTSGQMSIGDIQAFIQYSRTFSMPLTQLASMMNVFQSGIASLERVIELSIRQEREGLGDAPWPPHYRKQSGEPARVQPSRRRTPSRPLIEIARARQKPDALAGLERWRTRHPEAAAHLTPADVLVDAMRGRFRTWTRIRVNLEHVPEALRPVQEALDPDDDLSSDWSGSSMSSRAPGTSPRRGVSGNEAPRKTNE